MWKRDWSLMTAVAGVLALGVMAGAGDAVAQGAAPKKDAAKGAAPAQPAAGQPSGAMWVKLCEKAPFVGQDKDGKEVRQDRSICLTHHERLEAMSGMVLVSAAIRDIEGADKKHLMVMLPLGVALPPGMQVGVYPKDMWEKVQKGEKVDDSKLTPIKLTYTLCHSAGCTAEVEATKELLDQIQSGAGLIVFAVNGNGVPTAFPVPLTGFKEALAGPPADNETYSKQRRDLLKQIAENRSKMIEEYRKQNEELQKVAPRVTPAAGAPAAAPAAQQPKK
jgi:invasion protein IalB